jgi:peroxiredoxin
MKQVGTTIRVSLYFSKVISFVCVVFLFCTCQDVQDDFSGIVGMKAPAFTLYNTEGSRVNLTDYKGKVIVLFFFGNASPECKTVVPDFKEKLVDPYADKADYVVLGLDYWNGDIDNVRAFGKDTGIGIPLLLDAGNVGTNYRTFYNRIVIIDKDLNVAFSGTKEVSLDMLAAKIKVGNLLEK